MMKYCNNVFYETKHYIKHLPHFTFKQKIKNLLMWLFYPFLNIYNKILVSFIYLFHPTNPFKKEYPVVLVAIFKNEAKYLKEWIEYHKLIGVDHFFLYNNNSEDNYLDILNEYIKDGSVTLTTWPQVPGQISAYKNWYDKYREKCGYAAFIDLDEMICPIYDSDIKTWLKRYLKYPVVKMDWMMFGTSSQLSHDTNRLIIEQYESCWSKRLTIGKCIYNCSFNIDKLNSICMHLTDVTWYFFKVYPVNDSKNITLWGGYDICFRRTHTIQLNHYYSRSLDGLRGKIERGDAVFKDKQFTISNYMERENMNKNKDYTIQRFMLQLKLKMNNIKL